MSGYRAPAMTSRAGVTYRQLDYWTRLGYLRAFSDGAGTGHHRQWPAGEMDVAAVMARLVAAGLTPAAAHTVARSPSRACELGPGIRITVSTP